MPEKVPVQLLEKLVTAMERRGASGYTPFLAAVFVGGLRMTEEHLWIYVPRNLRRDPVVWLGHTLMFYVALALCIAGLLRWVLRREPRHVVSAVCAGLLCGVLPPLIDAPLYGPGNFNYDYRPAGLTGLPWLFYDPPLVTPLGETVTLWLSIGLMALYAWVTSKSALKTALTVLGHYLLVLVFLAVLPMLAYQARVAWPELTLNEATGAALLLAALLGLGTLRPHLALRFVRRLPHSAVAPALVLVGSAFLGEANASTGLAMLALFVSASIFAIHNDYFDRADDAGRSSDPIANHDDVVMLALVPVPFWLILTAGHFWVTVACLLFTVVAFAYHADPLRLRCVFPLSYKTEGLLGLACFVAGVLAHSRRLVPMSAAVAALLCAGGVSLLAMLKDSKDVERDRAAAARTIYVVLTERGWSERRVDALVGAAMALCLCVPLAYLGLARGQAGLAAVAALVAVLGVASFWWLRMRAHAVAVSLTLISVYVCVVAMGLLRSASAGG